MNDGRIIAISGLDGSGKSTQKRLLVEKLEAFGKPIQYVKVRIGYTPGFQTLRGGKLKKKERKMERRKSGLPKKQKPKRAWVYKLYLQFALLDFVRVLFWVRLLRWMGNFVVCDRYLWDNYVIIKEKVPGIDLENWLMWKVARAVALQPDLSVFLALPAEIAYERIITRSGGAESQSLAGLSKREQLYSSVNEEAGWVILSATESPDKLAAEIWNKAQQILIW